ncbi:hypothetical protein HK405_005001 [Cladochytrium tenue]|nr:hypothetical protein HK405_005001 [Cladochytrium tenue]
MAVPAALGALAAALLAAAAAPVHAQSSTDPCAALATSNSYFLGSSTTPTVVTGAELFACYSSFTVTDTVKAKHVAVLKSYLDLYPYTDIAKSSSSPYFSSQVDIKSVLDTIASDTTVTTEFAFQTKIQAALASLNDAHISYAPTCFTQMSLSQPFIIDARYKAGSTPTLYIRDTVVNGSAVYSGAASTLTTPLTSAWSNATNGDPTTYVNYTIKTINSIDAVQFIQYFADYWSSASHTPEARFNSMLPRLDWNNVTSTTKFVDGTSYLMASVPSDMNLTWTYELQSPAGETVTLTNVPWAGYFKSTSSFNDSSAYYQLFCSSSTTSSLELASVIRIVPPTRNPGVTLDLDIAMQAIQVKTLASASALSVSEKAATTAFSISSPRVQGEATSFHMLDDGTTGVWFLTSFSPADGSTAGFSAFLGTVVTGLLNLEAAGATKLIIDFSGNGGGDMCLGDAIMKYLMNQGIWLAVDFRLTQASTSIISWANTATGLVASSNAGGLFGMTTSIPVQGSNVLNNTVTYTRGGGASVYSGKFYLNCTDHEVVANALTQLTKGWSPDTIAIVTDGQCGSTCGHFTRVLRDEYGVKTFVTGGSSGAAYQPSSFEGANVGSWAAVRTEAIAVYQAQSGSISESEAASWPLTAFPLPVGGQLPLWETYSPKGAGQMDQPVEWMPEPADAFVDVADVSDKAAVWSAVASAFAAPTNSGRSAGAAQATPTIETNGNGTVGNVSTASSTKSGGAPGSAAGAAVMAAAVAVAALVSAAVALL